MTVEEWCEESQRGQTYPSAYRTQKEAVEAGKGLPVVAWKVGNDGYYRLIRVSDGFGLSRLA